MSAPSPDDVIAEIATLFPHLRDRLTLDTRLADLRLDSLDLVELSCLLDEHGLRLQQADFEPDATLRNVVASVHDVVPEQASER